MVEEIIVSSMLAYFLFDQFQAIIPCLYLLKIENLFSDVFSGYRNETLAWNRFILNPRILISFISYAYSWNAFTGPPTLFFGNQTTKNMDFEKTNLFLWTKYVKLNIWCNKQNILLTYMSSTTLQLIFADIVYSHWLFSSHTNCSFHFESFAFSFSLFPFACVLHRSISPSNVNFFSFPFVSGVWWTFFSKTASIFNEFCS